MLIEVGGEIATVASDAGRSSQDGKALDDFVDLVTREVGLVAETDEIHIFGAELEKDAVELWIVVDVLFAALPLIL